MLFEINHVNLNGYFLEIAHHEMQFNFITDFVMLFVFRQQSNFLLLELFKL